MLDPLTCVSLASAIVQFVDYGGRLFSEIKELYESAKGSLSQNEELQAVTDDLKQLCVNLSVAHSGTASARPPTIDELALLELTRSCKDIADELLAELEGLKVKGRREKWQSFKKALKSAMKREKIESIKSRLDRVQNQIHMLITNLLRESQSSLISNVQELIDRSHKLEARMTEELESLTLQLNRAVRKSIDNDAETRGTLQDISAKLIKLRLNTEANKVQINVKLLESLRYASMNARQSEVKDEHAETFRWILEKDEDRNCESPRFMEWLESGGGIYWVAGKAGSGKSTLMKFLWHHTGKRSALRTWAGINDKLVLASHFFWNAGNNFMQMSQIGLLRSLLFQILRQCPDLIPIIKESKLDNDDIFPDFQWTLKELLAAFERLSDPAKAPIKLCFFIDGLDEYDGNHSDVVQLFQKFSSSSHVKICLSSRPWNVFQNAFGNGQNPKLMLENLTKEDIKLYVSDKLGEDYRFQALADADQRYRDLVEEVVVKAQGVFLWVVLVVQSLLDGLTDDNSIPDMQRRLEMLPSDLRDLFQLITDGIDEVYKPQAAQILEMVTVARSPLSVFLLKYFDEERSDPYYAVKAKRKALPETEMVKLRKKLAIYLNARCKGLLEIHYDEDKTFSFGHKIEFLHRTVRDYLRAPEVRTLMRFQAPRGFNPYTTLCRAYLALLKELQPYEIGLYYEDHADLDDVCREIMHYARSVEIEHDRSEWAVLDELDRFYATVLRPGRKPFTRTHDDMGDWEEIVKDSLGATFLEWAVEAGLVTYVDRKLRQAPTLLFDGRPRPLLSHALQQGEDHQIEYLDPEMVRLLLSFGADPNEEILNSEGYVTVWSSFVDECEDSLEAMPDIEKYNACKAAVMLLEAGANPSLICRDHNFRSSNTAYFHLLQPWKNLSKTQRVLLEQALSTANKLSQGSLNIAQSKR